MLNEFTINKKKLFRAELSSSCNQAKIRRMRRRRRRAAEASAYSKKVGHMLKCVAIINDSLADKKEIAFIQSARGRSQVSGGGGLFEAFFAFSDTKTAALSSFFAYF